MEFSGGQLQYSCNWLRLWRQHGNNSKHKHYLITIRNVVAKKIIGRIFQIKDGMVDAAVENLVTILVLGILFTVTKNRNVRAGSVSPYKRIEDGGAYHQSKAVGDSPYR